MIYKKINPITFEIVRNSFEHITRMMSQTIEKISFSPNLYDMVDFSNGLFNRDSQLIAQSTNVLTHIAAMQYNVEAVLNHFGEQGLHEGDIAVINDPYTGGTHIPDLTFVTPIFCENTLVAFAANQGHWPDLGGAASASEVPNATHIVEEGLRLSPVLIYKNREPVKSIIEIIRNNSRTPYFIEGDLRAHLGALNTAESNFRQIVRRYGVKTIRTCMEESLNYTENRTRSAIREFPDGTYQAEDYVDCDGISPASIPIRVTLVIDGDRIQVDFTGSSNTVDGPINLPLGGTHSAVYWSLKFFLDPFTPPNAGMFRPISIITPENNIVNANWPAPVYFGNLITSEIIADVIWQSLARAIPDKMVGMPYGNCNPITFGILDPRKGISYSFGDLPPGGWGGTPYGNGMSATYSRHANCKDLSPEEMEQLYPVRLLCRELIPDSGGAGYHRGGLAIRETFQVLENSKVTSGMNRTKKGPPGIKGGAPGKPGRIIKNRGRLNEEIWGGLVENKRKKWRMSMFGNRLLVAEDEITIETQGGGGWGDPLERSRELVLKDLDEGYITGEGALHNYRQTISHQDE